MIQTIRTFKHVAVILTAAVLISFSNTDTTTKATAEVNQLQGLYVFTDSKPVAAYDYLGTVKNGTRIAGSAQYQPVRDRLIKKIKEDFPNAEGVIFSFVNGAADKADAIKFK